jgi:hypothetical protein
MNTKQIEIPAGSRVKLLVSTPKENLELNGEFAGFVPVGQVTFLAIQETTLEKVVQMMIPLHLVSLMEFQVNLSKLVQ